MSAAALSSSARFALSAAGFIATSTFGVSPGVRMSREAKWIWNAETPASVPAGARISAGKFGSVARSLPTIAVASVNRLPTSCIPSPESPAKRTTTRSRSSTVLVICVRQGSIRLTHSTREPRRSFALGPNGPPNGWLTRFYGPLTRHPWGHPPRPDGPARPHGRRRRWPSLNLVHVYCFGALRGGLLLIGDLAALGERAVAVGGDVVGV